MSRPQATEGNDMSHRESSGGMHLPSNCMEEHVSQEKGSACTMQPTEMVVVPSSLQRLPVGLVLLAGATTSFPSW